jgi:hypothetical protein
MKPARKFAQVSRRFYRPEQSHCPVCQRRLQRSVTLTERTVITLEEVIKLVHAGYRCPDAQCEGHQRTYRSVKADALALPWFTYGMDIVLLVGRLRLREHQTVDEVHEELLERLAPLGVRISRREILYLFEAYCTLLRASSEAKDDLEWLAEARKERGHHRLSGWHPAGEGQRDGLRGARCAQRAGAGGRERDVVGDGGDEGAARSGGDVRGEGAGHDQ